jgi:hypothetical protein
MSKKSIEAAIGKAILDAKFRAALLAAPDKALAGFDLSSAEKNTLKRVDGETLELLARVLSARLSGASRNSHGMNFHTNIQQIRSNE